MSDDQLDIMRRAEGAVRIAGRLIVNDNIDLDIKEKGKTDFVTKLDFAVQEHLKNSLKAIAPQYSLFSEEKDNTDILSEEKLWILDPVDGTTNLIHNFCHSAISLALADKGDVIGAIVYQPFSGEMFTAFKGKGAFLNGKSISVSSASGLSDSLFSVGTNPGCREKSESAFSIMRKFYDRCHDIRRIGAASIELCYVAAGRLEGYTEQGLMPWDFAAGGLILREAGGKITDYQGNIPSCIRRSDIIATNGKIHNEASALL